MAWSKSTRISVMLGIDIAFFLLELIVGIIVQSLALTADAFHMLNDIISLLVGLWAVMVARRATTDKYSYGWLRAEILGAFFNAVFLIALCLTIMLEALTRFIDPPTISNPKLILIVGCMGLASNLVGFLVLGGHGHSHGNEQPEDEGAHAHVHSHANGNNALAAAEEGQISADGQLSHPSDESGRIADLLPEAAVSRYAAQSPETGRHITFDSSEDALERTGTRGTIGQSRGRQRRRTGSIRHRNLTSIEDISIHPASFRQEIIAASRPQLEDDGSSSEDYDDGEAEDGIAITAEPESYEETPIIKQDANGNKNANGGGIYGATRSASQQARLESGLHNTHNHNQSRRSQKGGGHSHGHGHNHGDMGMNAMVLHVLGDALGNVGVICTALIIWLTPWPGRFYADPAVSLFITLIILRSALPLTFATAKILLQATPDHISVNEIREDIEALPGVVSCHHVHIWQLSDTKIVASMHIQVAFPISEEGGERYMELAMRARRCLHAYGIHSATIQPEFCLDAAHNHGEQLVAAGRVAAAAEGLNLDGAAATAAVAAAAPCAAENGASTIKPDVRLGDRCLLECVDDCNGQGCCPLQPSASQASSHSAHSEDGGVPHNH